MDHRTYHELAAADALDDITRLERLRLGVHVRRCGACAALRRDLRETTALMALAPAQLQPPDGLWAAVLRSIHDPDGAATPDTAEVVALRRRTRQLRAGALAASGLAAVLAVAVVGLGATTISLSDRLAAADAASASLVARLDAQEGVLAVALDPGHATASLDALPDAAGATASVVYAPGRNDAYLVARDLPPTPAGHVYQLWIADADGVHPLGTFTSAGGGVVVVPFGTDLAGKKAAMVTIEPDGGATGTPGPEVLFGTL